MDNPGTLPIFVYNNTEKQTHERVALEQEISVSVPPADEDEIPLQEQQQRRTRSGRVSKARRQPDMLQH